LGTEEEGESFAPNNFASRSLRSTPFGKKEKKGLWRAGTSRRGKGQSKKGKGRRETQPTWEAKQITYIEVKKQPA
jgi:hypothetical protein